MNEPHEFHSSLRILSARPPIEGQQVGTMNELITIGARLSYLHKLVWVISESNFYYLRTGDGSSLDHWSPAMTGGIFQYVDRVYASGSGVILNGSVYISLETIAEGESPISHPNKWLNVSTMTFSTFALQNQTEVILPTNLIAPVVIAYDSENKLVSLDVTKVQTGVRINANPAFSGTVYIK